MTKFYDAVYSFERVGGYQFVKLYISMFEKWLESPQWLLAVSKPEVRMRVTSAWGQEYSKFKSQTQHISDNQRLYFLSHQLLALKSKLSYHRNPVTRILHLWYREYQCCPVWARKGFLENLKIKHEFVRKNFFVGSPGNSGRLDRYGIISSTVKSLI